VVREGLAQRISRQPDLEVCGEAEDQPTALRLSSQLKPDVAVIDIGLKNGNGLDLVRRLKDRRDPVRMLVWSMYSETQYAERALRAGALGFITKDQPTEQIIDAIHHVQHDKIYLSEKMSERLLRKSIGEKDEALTRNPLEALSDRELEVFRLIGLGKETREIAEKMQLSPKTVETYQARIKEKLDLTSARELVVYASQWNEPRTK
jgi:DNA-binding NarL/FixJ family response regulator